MCQRVLLSSLKGCMNEGERADVWVPIFSLDADLDTVLFRY
jgi:hypothetical protein